jgi:hypothetical protein
MLDTTFANEITSHLDEQVIIVSTDIPDANRVQLTDGIFITRIGDSLFVEDYVSDWAESTYGQWHELDADLALLRKNRTV